MHFGKAWLEQSGVMPGCRVWFANSVGIHKLESEDRMKLKFKEKGLSLDEIEV